MVDGSAPSDPRPPRRSNKENANAWAAQHAKAVHHRLNHALLAAARISRGSDRALAWANCLRNEWDSSDHHKHHQSGPSVFTRQFREGALFGATGLVQRGSIPFCTLPPGSPVCWHCADHRGVHGQLCAVKEGQTISDHFQTTVVSSWHWQKVQVLDTDVHRHPCSCFPADSCRNSPRRPKTPAVVQAPRQVAELERLPHP